LRLWRSAIAGADMKKNLFAFVTFMTTVCAAPIMATESEVPLSGFGSVDHVFLIMMENRTDTNIIHNPNVRFINGYALVANQATNYFAIGHPSLPNYLELVGGSNFGVKGDYSPAWVAGGCTDNAPGSTGCKDAVPPISTAGKDNEVPATATNSSQCNGEVVVAGSNEAAQNNCALHDYPAAAYTPETIADQLVAGGKSWKAYEESLPIIQPTVAGINYSDGVFSNLSPKAVFEPGPIQKLYAVKHNPFAYFRNIQLGKKPALSLDRVNDFDGPFGLWADLQSGNVPNFSFIVPNQCHDMHGMVSGGPQICSTRNPAETALLISEGDAEVQKLIGGIKASRSWKEGRNAIILVWDENDYSNAENRVLMLVETNYAQNGQKDPGAYDHFSLLRTLEAAFGLRCLNHACDATSKVMNKMFGG
jgi:hypothetical protein